MLVHRPAAPLSGFVDYLWIQEGPAPSHTVERVLPTGTTEIVIALAEAPLRVAEADGALGAIGSAMIVGACSRPFAVDTSPQTALMGVHFKPGGAFPFFALPASEIRDAKIDLELFWHEGVRALRDGLIAARTPAARFGLLERALVARIVRPLARHPAVVCALRAFTNAPEAARIAAIRTETGLSARRFIEVFDREVGLTPKLFARVCRIQAVLRQIEDPGAVDWVETALAEGFFDQAHLIRDFREFTGLAPNDYVARDRPSAGHVVIPERG